MKHVIIVGASSGIGYSLAEALARGGMRVGIAARRTDALKSLKEKYPQQIEYCGIDITEPDAERRLIDLITLTGGMELYIHAAGTGVANPKLNPELEVGVLRTNVDGFARCICTAYGWMRAQRVKGVIAAITSVAGTNGLSRMAAYSASKAFEQTYLRALEQHARLQKNGISFTDIRPGWVRTPLLDPYVRYPMEMTVPYVTARILKAIARRKRVAVIDCRWNMVVGLWRLIPNSLWVRINLPLSKPDTPLPSGRQSR